MGRREEQQETEERKQMSSAGRRQEQSRGFKAGLGWGGGLGGVLMHRLLLRKTCGEQKWGCRLSATQTPTARGLGFAFAYG